LASAIEAPKEFFLGQSTALDDYPPTAETGGMGSPYAQKILFFFCRPCAEYHEKMHPHYRAMKRRKAKRLKEREAAQAVQPEQRAD